jgi:type II secretory pathway pseudopilin PulG
MPIVLALLRLLVICWVMSILGAGAAIVYALHLDRVEQREAERVARLAAHKADIRATQKAYLHWNGES